MSQGTRNKNDLLKFYSKNIAGLNHDFTVVELGDKKCISKYFIKTIDI